MKSKKGFRPGDFAIFVLILLGAGLIWLRFALMQTDHVYGEIWQDGELVKRIVLDDGYHDTLQIEGHSIDSTIEIDGKRMRFVNSKCPDHTCELTGWVDKVGDTAVCLPARVLIKITSADGDDSGSGIDAVVQ